MHVVGKRFQAGSIGTESESSRGQPAQEKVLEQEDNAIYFPKCPYPCYQMLNRPGIPNLAQSTQNKTPKMERDIAAYPEERSFAHHEMQTQITMTQRPPHQP
jgi:hypothetical protein